jgi:hypothetical protein
MQARAAANWIFLCYGARRTESIPIMTSSAEETNPTGTSDKGTGDAQSSAGACCGGIFDDVCDATEKFARDEPLKTTASVFVIGLVLAMLPIGQIAGGLVRLAFALLRPALLVLGVMKVFEECEKRRS